MARDDLTRLSVNMNPETTDALLRYVATHDVTYTEAVRRAISLLDFMDEARAEGSRILVESADRKTMRQMVLL